jgi:hypothetical protein
MREVVRILDYRQLQGGVWHVCLQWYLVQPRESKERKDVRDEEDLQSGCGHLVGEAILFVSWES